MGRGTFGTIYETRFVLGDFVAGSYRTTGLKLLPGIHIGLQHPEFYIGLCYNLSEVLIKVL